MLVCFQKVFVITAFMVCGLVPKVGNAQQLTIEDYKIIMGEYVKLRDGLKLDPWFSHFATTNALMVMMDSSAGILGRYRSFTNVPSELLNRIPSVQNRTQVAEAATLLSLKEYSTRLELRWEPFLNLEDRAKFQVIKENFVKLVQTKLDKYSQVELQLAKPFSENTIRMIVDEFRKNSEGEIYTYNTGNSPGQFRLEPEVLFPDVYSRWIGFKPFATCSFGELTKGMKTELPEFDSNYVADLEELRCLARQDNEDGTPILGPNCKRAISDEEFNSMNLGYSYWNTQLQIGEHISKSRGYDFFDWLRFRLFLSLGTFEPQIYSWSMRPYMNHWRPASAIRNGSGGEKSLWTVEPGWKSRGGDDYEQPEYPSGSASQAGSATTLVGLILDEDSRHQNNGKNVSTIDGQVPNLKWSAEFNRGGVDQTVERRVYNLDQFAWAMVDARVFSGGHFRFSAVDGLGLGQRVGRQIWNNGLFARTNGPNDRGSSFLDEEGRFRYCQ